MWQDWKFIVIVALLVVTIAVGGTLGGIALARSNSNNADHSQTMNTLMQEAATLFQENTNNADNTPGLGKFFNQDKQTLKSDAIDSILTKLVENGVITQEQADQFKAWWNSRPDMPAFNGQNAQPGMRFFGMMHGGNSGFGFRFGVGSK